MTAYNRWRDRWTWHFRPQPQKPRFFWSASKESRPLGRSNTEMSIKSDKSEWLNMRNKNTTHAQKIGSGHLQHRRIDVLQAEAKTLPVFFPPFLLEGIAPRASAFSQAVLCTFGNLGTSYCFLTSGTNAHALSWTNEMSSWKTLSPRFSGSYVVSPDISWFETIYGKSLHERTNQRSNHHMQRGVTGNTTYLGVFVFPFRRTRVTWTLGTD